MKKFWKAFFLRGLLCAAGGPVILAIIYYAVGTANGISQISVTEVSLGILTSALLAFIAAGITAVYQMEQLPLPIAILLHGGVLYIAYILIYLCNGWLQKQFYPILIFTGIFIVSYALIWLIIYRNIKAKTAKINSKLNDEQ